MPEREQSLSGPICCGAVFPSNTHFCIIAGWLVQVTDPEGLACFPWLRDKWAHSRPFNCKVAPADHLGVTCEPPKSAEAL